MKILKLLDSHDGGGTHSCELQYIEELRNRGIKVDGIIIGSGDKKEIYRRSVSNAYFISEEFRYRRLRLIGSLFNARSYGERLAEVVSDQLHATDYDAVIYRRHFYLYLAGSLGETLKVPVYWFMPNSVESHFSRKYYTYFLKRYDIQPIANSRYTMSTLPGICNHFVYPGFQEEKIVPDSPTFRVELRIREDAPVYGVAARIQEDKAHDLVIRAFCESNIPDQGGHLFIAGGPLSTPYHKKLQQAAGELLDTQIHFLGHLTHMSSFYSSIDVLINGRHEAEPFGISIAEAVAYGRPVIAYHLGGPSEMVVDDETGWLAETSSVDAYKEKMNRSLEQRDQWKEMGVKSRNLSEQFSCRANVTKLISIINELGVCRA